MEDGLILERVKTLIDWLIFEKTIKNRRELAEKMGYTESSLSQILNGKVKLSEKFIKKLSDTAENINQHWILTGKGKMIIGDRLEEPVSPYNDKNNQTDYLLKIIDNLEYTISVQKTLIEELIGQKNRENNH